jgi:phosphoglycerate dehydrogenase-like enzyme
VYGLDSLHELLPRSDIVIIAVLLDESTHHLVDAEFLSLMPDGSLLVNISRGGVADTDALLAEARSGRIRLALDVTDPEPLPEGHPLTARGGNELRRPAADHATRSPTDRTNASR